MSDPKGSVYISTVISIGPDTLYVTSEHSDPNGTSSYLSIGTGQDGATTLLHWQDRADLRKLHDAIGEALGPFGEVAPGVVQPEWIEVRADELMLGDRLGPGRTFVTRIDPEPLSGYVAINGIPRNYGDLFLVKSAGRADLLAQAERADQEEALDRLDDEARGPDPDTQRDDRIERERYGDDAA